jgi:hypothetical protein
VIPELVVRAGWIVTQVDRFEEARGGIRRIRIRAPEFGIAQVGELICIALAAKRTPDSHWRPL